MTFTGIIPRDIDSGKGKFPASFDTYKVISKGNMVFCFFDIDETPRTVGLSNLEGMLTGAYTVFDVNDCNPRYPYYYYLSLDNVKALKPLYTGLRKTINVNTFLGTKMPLPSRTEQDQIVRYLDWQVSKINKLIAVKKKEIFVIKEHLQIAINNAVTKGIKKNPLLKDSGLFWMEDIPITWNVIKIKWLFSEDNRRNEQGSAELLTFSRSRGLIPFSEASDKEPSASDLSKYKLVSPGQLLENRMQAWSGMFIAVLREGCVSPDYSVFNPSKVRYVNVKFYEYVFRNPLQVQQFANASKGVGNGFNRLYTPAFGAIYTVYPPQSEQDEIVNYLDSLSIKYNEEIACIEREIEALHELRNKIISEAVTGQIDVRSIEIPDYEYVEEEADEGEEDSDEEIEEQEEE